MPSESAKEKFNQAVDQTRNSVGGAFPASSSPTFLVLRCPLMHLLMHFSDSKGPAGGMLKTAQPSKDSADISNKFVNPGRTAQPHPDTTEADQKTAGNTLSFFKSSAT